MDLLYKDKMLFGGLVIIFILGILTTTYKPVWDGPDVLKDNSSFYYRFERKVYKF